MRVRLNDLPGKTRQIGPYSSPASLAKLDGRTREAALLRRVREELVGHVGGNPSATERALIERATWLSLRLAQLDAKMAADPQSFSQHDSNVYISWSNALTRTVARLGLKEKEAAPPTLGDYLARKREAAA